MQGKHEKKERARLLYHQHFINFWSLPACAFFDQLHLEFANATLDTLMRTNYSDTDSLVLILEKASGGETNPGALLEIGTVSNRYG